MGDVTPVQMRDGVLRCPRDSDWCDGRICREVGFKPDCPNADPTPFQRRTDEALRIAREVRKGTR